MIPSTAIWIYVSKTREIKRKRRRRGGEEERRRNPSGRFD